MEEDPRAHYAYHCAECGENFPPNGKGHSAAGKHAKEEHETDNPGEVIEGLIDTRTGEVLYAGWGSSKLTAARNRGLLDDTEEKAAEKAASMTDAASKKPGKLTMKEKAALAVQEQTGRTIMKDLVIPRMVELAFGEAQILWPDQYGGGSKEQFSAYIEEMVAVANIYLETEVGNVIIKEFIDRIADKENAEQLEEEDIDG